MTAIATDTDLLGRDAMEQIVTHESDPRLFCGATSFGSKHAFEPGGWQRRDDCYEWETCDKPASDQVHRMEEEVTDELDD